MTTWWGPCLTGSQRLLWRALARPHKRLALRRAPPRRQGAVDRMAALSAGSQSGPRPARPTAGQLRRLPVP